MRNGALFAKVIPDLKRILDVFLAENVVLAGPVDHLAHGCPFGCFPCGENNSPLGVTLATGIRFLHVEP